MSPALQADSLPSEPLGKLLECMVQSKKQQQNKEQLPFLPRAPEEAGLKARTRERGQAVPSTPAGPMTPHLPPTSSWGARCSLTLNQNFSPRVYKLFSSSTWPLIGFSLDLKNEKLHCSFLKNHLVTLPNLSHSP